MIIQCIQYYLVYNSVKYLSFLGYILK